MRVCQRTHQGLVRSSNQDCLLVDDRVYGVADGMGGHQGGETASRVAVQVLKNALRGKLPDRRALEVGVEAANRRVYDMARHDSSLSGMGTTVTLIWEDGKRVLVGHVGDSRAYRLRGGELMQITQDHSIVAELLRNNVITTEMARNHPYRNVITRAVGVDPGRCSRCQRAGQAAGRRVAGVLRRAVQHGVRRRDPRYPRPQRNRRAGRRPPAFAGTGSRRYR